MYLNIANKKDFDLHPV